MDKDDLEKEFEAILIDYGGLINKICYSFSTNSDEFKDLRQEVWYHIWKGLRQFRHDSKLSTWIYRICLNSCISFQRKEKIFSKVPVDNVLNVADESYSKLEQYKEMYALIKKLNYSDRALILMWLDDMTYEEISALTGQNRNTIATRLKRVKEKLVNMNA
ncbi:MAG: sigma-70 family RNA polymerase sigma factor [Muribaculaceae bacterium]|nr:sigma-70 family RNA polymerase sigma factor [Muribaculaceae bacterium]